MSKRASSGVDPEVLDGITRPIEQIKADIAAPLEELRRYQTELGDILGRFEEDRSPADRLTRHIRRHLPLYALGTIWALMLILVPTINDDDTSQVGAIANAPGSTGGGTTPRFGGDFDTTGTPASGGGGTQVGGGGTARSDGGEAAADTADPGETAQAATGPTRAGFQCEPGVRQIPWSAYAAPCLPAQSGNPGATYRGVDEESIKITVRRTGDEGGPNSRAVDEVNRQAGNATAAEAVDILHEYVNFFNEVYELHGRKVVLEPWDSQVSNGTDEAQSKGREAACADANAIASNEESFGVIAWSSSFIESEPFSDCAAQQGLFIPAGAAYFPETFYQRWHPYVFNTVMECERIARDVAEYVGKRLAFKNAKWAGDALYQAQERVFGVYVPDNDGYQSCVDIYDNIAEDGGYKTHSRFDYTLDVSQFAHQAAAGVLQFKADGVTSLVLACDTISTIFLTQAAEQNKWFPEWLIIGVAGQDTNGQARLWEPNQVDGHLFGMSQLGNDADIQGPDGEAAQTWKAMHPDQDPPRGFGGIYFQALHIFNLLQAGGANLTPQSIADNVTSLGVGGGADAAVGTWFYDADHTAIKDSREIYWDGSAEGFDGGSGSYIETYGGKRFKTGEWPAEEPPVYPDR